MKTLKIKDWAWGTETPIKKTTEHFEVSGSIDYSNSKHSGVYNSQDEAENEWNKKRSKNDSYDDYWNNQDEIITKVTIITEIVKVIKSEDKV